MPNGETPSDSQLELPRELHRAMGELHDGPIEVPAHLDRMILSAAHIRLGRRKRAVRVLQWSFAAAAAIALLVTACFTFMEKTGTGQVAVMGDINADGRVDILDAFVVARGIQHHEKLTAAWDVNGDGVIDQKDVELLAQMAVNVSKGPAR